MSIVSKNCCFLVIHATLIKQKCYLTTVYYNYNKFSLITTHKFVSYNLRSLTKKKWKYIKEFCDYCNKQKSEQLYRQTLVRITPCLAPINHARFLWKIFGSLWKEIKRTFQSLWWKMELELLNFNVGIGDNDNN